jgi:hypothetical protein
MVLEGIDAETGFVMARICLRRCDRVFSHGIWQTATLPPRGVDNASNQVWEKAFQTWD